MVPSKIDWADVMIAASAAREPFEDIALITTKKAFVELAYEAAADVVHKGGNQLQFDSVNAVAVALINAQKVHVQEYVEVVDTGITVCLDVEDINSDTAVWRSMDLLSRALDTLQGTCGTVYFGENLKYTVSQVPSILSSDHLVLGN